MQHISRSGTPSVVALAGVAVLACLATSCSSPTATREYAVPKDLCGTSISPSVLEPILPAGQKISAQSTSAVGIKRCRLLVDNQIVFSSSVEKRGADTSARDMAMSAIGVEPTDTSADGGRVIFSKTGAVGLVDCSHSAAAKSSLWVTVRTSHGSSASAVRRFVEEYAGAVAKTGACDELTAD